LSILLDTSVAIPWRDGDPAVMARLAALTTAPYVSILTMAELEGGVHAKPGLSALRRAALSALEGRLDVLPFNDAALAAYRSILEDCGYARAKVLDRLIAATALAHHLRLATRNPKDFGDVPGLVVEAW
jgi:tRNA(fMet)-specific endonuclease VapC